MKGRVSKDQLAGIVDGANKLVDELRAMNEAGEINRGLPHIDDGQYDELRFELLWTFLRRARS